MNNELLLLSKNDIPFLEAQVNIHQPTISEIALIGEEIFWSGCQFLNFSKDLLSEQDKNDLEDKSDFEIFMSIMCAKEGAIYKNNVTFVLALLFPSFNIKFLPNELVFLNDNGMARINSTNFDIFKDIISSMFVLEELKGATEYNPVDNRAKKIAEKLKKAKDRKNKENGNDNKKVSILSRYVSILSVGESKDMNDFMQYTVFQLKDEFKRYQMKQSFDMYLQAKMAGAQNLDDVDNWMDDIHS